MNKEELNKTYNTEHIHGKVCKELDLISAKFVTVKKERVCNDCHRTIKKNETALTSSKNRGGMNVRIWRCEKCGVRSIESAKVEDQELIFDLAFEAAYDNCY